MVGYNLTHLIEIGLMYVRIWTFKQGSCFACLSFDYVPEPDLSSQNENKYLSENIPTARKASNLNLPELPTVPSDTPTHFASGSFDEKKNNDEEEEIDFDDLTFRFEALRKKK